MFNILFEQIEDMDKKEQYFVLRTMNHIHLVRKAAIEIVKAHPEFKELLVNVASHDKSKLEEPEYSPYIELTWNTYKNKEPYKTPGTIDDEKQNQATLHHILNNSHHPEYWLENKEDANIDPKDRNKSLKVVDASKMPPIAIAEMVADWQAMSEELQKGTTRDGLISRRMFAGILVLNRKNLLIN